MATPSSSVTSASPPTRFVHPGSPALSMDLDPIEKEDRQKAVEKFLASAELSVVTRALRARLSYASYKAIHNIPHVPLNDLEEKTRRLSVAPNRVIGTKRKASTGNSNHYNNPATQDVHPRKGTMEPPATSTSISRSYYPTANNLFTTLLGTPPLKQARTVHNSSDPPLEAASRSPVGSRPRKGSRASDHAPTVRSVAEGTRAQARNRKQDTVRPRGKRADKGKRKESAEHAADVERQAVATLTSLLHARPSIASVSSPRSSLSAGSDAGSLQSLSQYAQSSARTTTSLLPSAESSFAIPNRSATPPRPSADNTHSTPRADDEEAANLMLYLHTSPSPVRPTTTRDRDARDLAAFRSLGNGGAGSSLRAKGRVLFAGGSADGAKSPLRSEGSFAATESLPSSQEEPRSLGLPPRLDTDANNHNHNYEGGAGLAPPAPMEPNIIPPTPTTLSPPPLHLRASPSHLPPNVSSPSHRPDFFPRPDAMPPIIQQAPPTPGNVPFNFNDFINVSPSPAVATVPRSSLKSGLGGGDSLRADVGRKLFEEEQHRQHHVDGGGLGRKYADGLGSDQVEGVGRGNGLGAGINLIRS
ncbi:hypothetical protein BJ138DRAFT_18002 [Hygrophoropsis aurantiaca]|uniref:Uncharacterized protein n=1 Tax=Hygrophoropsis aurantiaca TaxID=72124 RepID=A0ACB8ARN4_9AGAM|nr:hypothetical protein BJ138DRAFT_18002 [Hygrophoropsis aurantiaca]